MKTSKLFLVALLGVLCFFSCGDDNDESTAEAGNRYQYLNATSYKDWVYFSFSQDKIVEVADFKNDLSWDIAFHRGDIRLNGGESGIGKGEAVNTGRTAWGSVLVAPESGYIADKIGTITVAFTGSDTETEEHPFSQTLSTWLTIDTNNPPPVYTYHNWVYVIKTADGKYVKLQIYDYKNEKNAAGYVSFKYKYNEDGSKNF